MLLKKIYLYMFSMKFSMEKQIIFFWIAGFFLLAINSYDKCNCLLAFYYKNCASKKVHQSDNSLLQVKSSNEKNFWLGYVVGFFKISNLAIMRLQSVSQTIHFYFFWSQQIRKSLQSKACFVMFEIRYWFIFSVLSWTYQAQIMEAE